MGRQPFGLASPAAWLGKAGHEVDCADLSRESLSRDLVNRAELIAFHLPMHTATRLAAKVIPRVRAWNPRAEVCCYGLYAPMNEAYLRELGAGTILGGEFEQGLLDLAGGNRAAPTETPGSSISTGKQQFLVPDRSRLPHLVRYSRLVNVGGAARVGYTEASRGCKHLCRHCPVVPVYNGVFRVVQRDVVIEDIRRQVAGGAQHITFGDPDFFNGIGHAIPLIETFHREFPGCSYDVTIKVSHLLDHREHLETLRRTGCLFVTSAVESFDDAVLSKLRKGHTREDFFDLARLMREAGLTLAPTFIAFHPWTTPESYRDLLRVIADLGLVENVAPIQLAIRLLIPSGSRMLELEEVRNLTGAFDKQALSYHWKHPDPAMDRLCADIQTLIKREETRRATRAETFRAIWNLAKQPDEFNLIPRAAIPYLNEPWYC
jgi:radical SAM superfamily enzyme YgiQ (UPF0313 family)